MDQFKIVQVNVLSPAQSFSVLGDVSEPWNTLVDKAFAKVPEGYQATSAYRAVYGNTDASAWCAECQRWVHQDEVFPERAGGSVYPESVAARHQSVCRRPA